METLLLKEPLRVVGLRVSTFPRGINKAFEQLARMFPESPTRSFFGLSKINRLGVEYYAGALELKFDDRDKPGLVTLEIPSGEYYFEPLEEWRQNLAAIPHMFHELFQLEGIDKNAPCVEWYENENRMICMVRKRE